MRFAGEMNGDWTPYHGNPKLYRQKFRLVHQVLHKYAPKVATIWCVNSIPFDNIIDYYPGDANCDWVGINIYSTPFADNDPSRAAFKDSPLALLDPLYRKFAARKPIAICEYAASHQSSVDGISRVSFAKEKMSLLYSALPLLYPRVKLIDWYSSDNLRHAREGRRLNNYRLTEHQELLQTYFQLTATPHFLNSPSQRSQSGSDWRELNAGEKGLPSQALGLWVTSAQPRAKVIVQAGNRVIYAASRFRAHYVRIDQQNGPITVLVFTQNNRCIGRRVYDISSIS